VRRSFYQVEASPGATVPDVDVATDLPFGIVRQTGRGPGARTYLLETMACGESARRAESSPARPPVEERAARLVRMLSGPRGRVVGHAECSWDDDEWSRGAYSFPRPGGYLAMQRIGDLGEERIHFAGEHASPWPGWMQGALYSGRRAARAIDPGVPDETDAPPVPDAPA
jgi:monoamine oxidase